MWVLRYLPAAPYFFKLIPFRQMWQGHKKSTPCGMLCNAILLPVSLELPESFLCFL